MTKNWIWMPHPGHFICARDCKFHLTTKAGNFIISTVGEMLPDSQVHEIFAKSHKVSLQGIGDERLADYMKKVGYEEIGFGRKYETMVFITKASKERCCPWIMAAARELDANGYNNAGDAYEGHLDMCYRWEKRPVPKAEAA